MVAPSSLFVSGRCRTVNHNRDTVGVYGHAVDHRTIASHGAISRDNAISGDSSVTNDWRIADYDCVGEISL
jgi:hypothetical protein